VPASATVAFEPVDELLLIVICPLAEPVAAGKNCTCTVMDCVGFSVVGKLAPMMVKPVPEIESELTFTGDVPVEVNVSDCVVAVFTVTLPKFRFVALTVNCGLVCGFDVVVPVPARVTVAELPASELLAIVICPLADPGAVGSNCT
jgi:hypothetical protein